MIDDKTVSGSKGGGKGGGGGGRAPVEAPNTLRSRSTARVVDLIGEGENGGLVNGAKSIFFDNTQLQNEDGTFNFTNVSWEERVGTPIQTHMAGFAAAEAEIGVGVLVTKATPVTRTVANMLADATRITLRLPNGMFKQDEKTGDVGDSTVKIQIKMKPNGGSYTLVAEDEITGKSVTPYEIAYRIEHTGTGPWDFQVLRVTDDDQGINTTNDVIWSSYTTIIDNKLMYPDSHVIGVAVDAESFGGSIPERGYEIYARIIKVPTNYDPVTRLYTGAWDGTFKTAWSDNPAWVFYDMLMHPRYGLGEFVTDNGTKWDLYPIGQYCDGMVPDGKGGMEPRFTFNGGFQTDDEAYRVIQAMASVFRGMAWWGSNTVAVSADMPTDATKIVSTANVLGGEIRLAGSALKARHTAVIVGWNDPTDGYRTNFEIVETDNPDLIQRLGWRVTDATAIACTSQGQAARLGRWILDSEEHETQMATYGASFDHANVSPGNVVDMADPSFSNLRRAGRVVSVGDNASSPLLYTSVTVDAPEELVGTETYTLHLTMPDGTRADVGITNPPGVTDTFLLETPLADAPLPNSMWSLTGNVTLRPFRVLGMKETEKNQFEIVALNHDPDKYDRVELGYKVQTTNFTTLPTGALLPPTNLAVSEYLYRAGGIGAKNAVTVSWTAARDPRAQYYEVDVRAPGLQWQRRETTSSVSVNLLDFGTGVFDFRVRAIDYAKRPSVWVELLNQSINLLQQPPAQVPNFRISILGDVATLTWDPVPNLNLSHYQIRFTPDLVTGDWQSSVVLLDNITTTSVQVPALVGTYSIKAITLQNVRSTDATLIVSDTVLFTTLNAIAMLIEDPAFAGVKDDTIRDATYPGITLDYGGDFFDPPDFFTFPDFFLQDQGYLETGIYYFDNALDLGEVFTSRVTAAMTAFAANFTSDFFDAVDFFDPADFFLVNPEDWGVTLQYRSTLDDPLASPVWTEWADFIVGDVTARAFEFRIVLTSFEYGVTPVVTGLRVSVDMPDRMISGKDLVVPITGLRVDYDPPFRGFSGMGVSSESLAPGDYAEITNKDENGFDIIYRDSVNNPVQRTFDFVSRGFGKKV